MASFNQDTGDFSQKILNLYLNNLVNDGNNSPYKFNSRLSNQLSEGDQILSNLVEKLINCIF
jgi:hypothetical protein